MRMPNWWYQVEHAIEEAVQEDFTVPVEILWDQIYHHYSTTVIPVRTSEGSHHEFCYNGTIIDLLESAAMAEANEDEVYQ